MSETTPPTAAEQPKRRGALTVLFLVVVIDLVGFGIVLPLLPRYAKEYQASSLELGVLMASFSAMQFLFAPLWGRLSDRHGRRPILMVGLFGSVLAYTLFGFAQSYEVLLISRLAAGFFGATIGAAQAYIADVTTREERGKGMALIGAAFGIGFTIGPAIGGVAHAWDARAPGLIAAVLSVVAFLLASRALPEPPRHEARAPRAFLDLSAIEHALATPTVMLILLLQFLGTFAFANFEGTLSLQTAERWQYTPKENGYVFTYVGFCLVLAQGAVVRRLMPKVGELNFVVVGSLLMSAGLLGVALATALPLLLVALLVAVLGFAMVTPSLASLLSRRTSPAHQGEILGLGQSMLSVARIFGPLVGNLAFGWNWMAPDLVAANLVLVAFLLALVLRRTPAADVSTPEPAE